MEMFDLYDIFLSLRVGIEYLQNFYHFKKTWFSENWVLASVFDMLRELRTNDDVIPKLKDEYEYDIVLCKKLVKS